MTKEILDYLLQEIAIVLPKVRVNIGAMPMIEGIGLYISSSGSNSEYWNRKRVNELIIAINSKAKKQTQAFEMLEKIQKHFTKKVKWMNTNELQVVNVRIGTAPIYNGQEDDESYLYSSSLYISYYDKNEKE